MLAEVVARHGLDRAGLAHRLQRHRQLIATLKEHTKVSALVLARTYKKESSVQESVQTLLNGMKRT